MMRRFAIWSILCLLAMVPTVEAQTWNPFGMTMRADNTMSITGVVLQFQDLEDGGCSFELHHSASLSNVKVILDPTRSRRCRALGRAVDLIQDPARQRVEVKASGRVSTEVAADGLGEKARAQLLELIGNLDCSKSPSGVPSAKALGPLQEAKQEIDRLGKQLENGSVIVFRARQSIDDAQLEIEEADPGPSVCEIIGIEELRRVLETLPDVQQQVLHGTSVRINKE